MLQNSSAFSGFSADDIVRAKDFYADILGLRVTETMGGLSIALPGGARLFIYPKADHQAATFTVLNFAVPDIESTVEALNARGVSTKIYPDEDFPTDARGIARGGGRGPDIAWFKDPAGNVIAVLQEPESSFPV